MAVERRMPRIERRPALKNQSETAVIFDLRFEDNDDAKDSTDSTDAPPEKTDNAHILEMKRGARPLNPDRRIVKKIELEAPGFTENEFSWFIPDADEPENS